MADRHGRQPWWPTRLHGLLQFLRWPERDLLARLDLDCLAGRRVSSHLRRPFPHLEGTEARQPVLSPFLKCFVASVTKLPRKASVAISIGRRPSTAGALRLAVRINDAGTFQSLQSRVAICIDRGLAQHRC
jgi:hypothetical protein